MLSLTGPISSVTVLGKTLIIINDRDLAFQILEKNSIKHSSRPHLVFAGELAGWGKLVLSQDNTPLLRAYRRAITRVIGTRESAAKFNGLIELEARRFAYRILHTPEKFLDHNRTASGAFILTITYGYNIEPRGEDPLVRLANLAVKKFSEAAVPGAWLVDFIPALKYVPEWMPGANFQKVAKDHVQTITRFAESPFAFTKAQMDRGKDRQCFVSTLLRQGEDEEIVKWLTAAMYGCAGDTTTAILEGFFLAMMLFPDVQRKAQAEMDELFGKPALPSATDRERLPYVNAIVKEATRWLTVAPLGIPHRTDQDDIINGYLIPKNAIIVPNTWSFNNDPTIYPNPRDFEPERFLSEPGALDPGDVSFGFGRRVCPRRLIAETSIFLIIAHTLAIFDIRKPVENGEEIKSTLDSTAGFLIHFVPFDASITPRSREHEQLIVDFEKTHPFETGDSKVLADAYH
ncbi:hypothetical protein N7536_011480 [Penicillium majusculum]|uniref:O-methylsterigmatocystin oxidoreductase n=1 Tax=Penicillium solitum TaxID=60172 RepID=A0A1V6QQG4_9EURO|nr:uncharacterized protein PENSOL_c053G09049 [Penicillium solitum]KAJ5680341.1 hypothetical protein N7536_011480 [Penicillium majusculum]OQD91458.1 hypothetical protein PENSOL_c053G09049 [Penicillium solitum]